MTLVLKRRVIAHGRAQDMRRLRRQLCRARLTGYRDDEVSGVIVVEACPPTLLYRDRDGIALVVELATLDGSS